MTFLMYVIESYIKPLNKAFEVIFIKNITILKVKSKILLYFKCMVYPAIQV